MNGSAVAVVVLVVLLVAAFIWAIVATMRAKPKTKRLARDRGMRATVRQYPGCAAGMASYVMTTDGMANNNIVNFDFDAPTCAVWPEGTPFPSAGLTAASWLGGNSGTAPVTIVDGNTGNVVATMPSYGYAVQCQMVCDGTLVCQSLGDLGTTCPK